MTLKSRVYTTAPQRSYWASTSVPKSISGRWVCCLISLPTPPPPDSPSHPFFFFFFPHKANAFSFQPTSSGCVLCELFLGRAPFQATTRLGIVEQLVHTLGPLPNRLRAGKFYTDEMARVEREWTSTFADMYRFDNGCVSPLFFSNFNFRIQSLQITFYQQAQGLPAYSPFTTPPDPQPRSSRSSHRAPRARSGT